MIKCVVIAILLISPKGFAKSPAQMTFDKGGYTFSKLLCEDYRFNSENKDLSFHKKAIKYFKDPGVRAGLAAQQFLTRDTFAGLVGKGNGYVKSLLVDPHFERGLKECAKAYNTPDLFDDVKLSLRKLESHSKMARNSAITLGSGLALGFTVKTGSALLRPFKKAAKIAKGLGITAIAGLTALVVKTGIENTRNIEDFLKNPEKQMDLMNQSHWNEQQQVNIELYAGLYLRKEKFNDLSEKEEKTMTQVFSRMQDHYALYKSTLEEISKVMGPEEIQICADRIQEKIEKQTPFDDLDRSCQKTYQLQLSLNIAIESLESEITTFDEDLNSVI